MANGRRIIKRKGKLNNTETCLINLASLKEIHIYVYTRSPCRMIHTMRSKVSPKTQQVHVNRWQCFPLAAQDRPVPPPLVKLPRCQLQARQVDPSSREGTYLSRQTSPNQCLRKIHSVAKLGLAPTKSPTSVFQNAHPTKKVRDQSSTLQTTSTSSLCRYVAASSRSSREVLFQKLPNNTPVTMSYNKADKDIGEAPVCCIPYPTTTST